MNGYTVATNTLLMPNVPAIFFQNPTVISTIRQHFESFGDLYTFVVIKGFRRLMIVYNETTSAVKARDFLDRRMLSWTTVDHSVVEDLSLDYISSMGCQAQQQQQQQPPSSPLPGRRYEDMIVRLYFGQHNPINPDPRLFQLQVPQSEKNFLISPPGSPFADWKQKTESPPNTAVLASDLTFHHHSDVVDDDLENFRLESPMSSDDEMEDVNATTTPTTPGKRSSLMVIGCSGDADNQVPMITVQDWDGDAVTTSTGSMLQGTTTSRPPASAFPKAKVVPTARPPVKI